MASFIVKERVQQNKVKKSIPPFWVIKCNLLKKKLCYQKLYFNLLCYLNVVLKIVAKA